MNRWKIRIESWPFSTGAGADEDQKAAGDRESEFEVKAEDARGALAAAELIVQGIKRNPRVWQAPITLIRKEFA